jgi:glycosyltransferase involved in cell wall biosynthesis
VFASRFAGATRDYVEHGSTGWIIDPSSADAIAAALLDALDERAAWSQIGAAARKRVRELSPEGAADGYVHALAIARERRASARRSGAVA